MKDQLVEETSGYDWWEGQYDLFREDIRARIVFERMADGDNGAIWCEARAWMTVSGEEHSLMPPSRVNLMNSTRGSGWKSLVDMLEDQTNEVAWNEVVSTSVSKAIEVYRTGNTEQPLKPNTGTTTHPFLLAPFIASTGVSVFFGEGGTGKSLLALGMAVAVASGQPIFGQTPRIVGPVTYFDYEDDPEVHEERLAAILKGTKTTLNYDIFHRSLVAKVSQSQASMRRSIADTGSVLAVLDSIGMGRGGNANGAEDTVRLFRALRSLEVPTLAVDHVTKEDKRSGNTISPYGSVYTINSGRLLWGAVVAEALSGEHEKYLNLTNTKANRTALHSKMGIRIEYQNQDQAETRSRWLDSVEFSTYNEWWQEDKATTWDQVKAHLELNAGLWTIRELELALGLGDKAIEKALASHGSELHRERKGKAYAYRLVAGPEEAIF